ncbi:DUF3667 domain-containing protein [Croceimicrobium sp.]|uniref:DUF3667 domain-containing protein n=1 Tax=Croceimicrobium sp. TaxID=2828340 RepID=UPI003BA97050
MLKRQKGSECLNCGQIIGDANFCSNCGQVNDTRRLTFIELIGESLSNFFAVDGRIFRTLKDVLIKPGKVATEFRLGKRVRYMNPVRFYFLASILLITSIQLNRDANLVNSNIDQESISRLKTLSDEERETAIQKAEDKLNKFEDPSIIIRFSAMSDYLIVKPESSKEELFNRLKLEPGFWNDFAFEQAQKTARFGHNQKDNFESFNRELISKLVWILFLFIPILGLVLKLLYFRRDFYYPEHLFFTLYQQGLFFFISFLYNLIIDNQTVFILIILLYGVHLFLAMHRFYGQSWGKTFFKYFLVNLFGLLSFIAFFMLSLVLVFILM